MTAYDINGEFLEGSSFTSSYEGYTFWGPVNISTQGIHTVVFADENPSGSNLDVFTFNLPVPVQQE